MSDCLGEDFMFFALPPLGVLNFRRSFVVVYVLGWRNNFDEIVTKLIFDSGLVLWSHNLSRFSGLVPPIYFQLQASAIKRFNLLSRHSARMVQARIQHVGVVRQCLIFPLLFFFFFSRFPSFFIAGAPVAPLSYFCCIDLLLSVVSERSFFSRIAFASLSAVFFLSVLYRGLQRDVQTCGAAAVQVM